MEKGEDTCSVWAGNYLFWVVCVMMMMICILYFVFCVCVVYACVVVSREITTSGSSLSSKTVNSTYCIVLGQRTYWEGLSRKITMC